jgi:phosphate starvation-inducible membrane PsiE
MQASMVTFSAPIAVLSIFNVQSTNCHLGMGIASGQTYCNYFEILAQCNIYFLYLDKTSFV